MRRDLSDAEIRVLGCLIEKQRTTPDAYPLSLNSLRLACNQSTNRDPVVDYDEATVREALGELGRRHWIRSASGHGGRTAKYRHLLEDELPLPDPELAVLTVLMLRGAQTPGELKQRAARIHSFEGVGAVLEALESLIGRELALRLPRRPGQKEERYEQLLGADRDEVDADESGQVAAPRTADVPVPTAAPTMPAPGAEESLLREVAALRVAVDALSERVARLEGDRGSG